MFDLDDYNFDLPAGLIAQVPSKRRDASRLLVLDRRSGAIRDRHFHDIPEQLSPGDLLVLNDTRVVPARLEGKKDTGGRVELLVLEHDEDGKPAAARLCLLKSSKPPQIGGLILLDDQVSGVVEEVQGNGVVVIRFDSPEALEKLIEERGRVPLPPYIKRTSPDTLAALDVERYQTVYAARKGAVAAPTAGLHFTRELIGRIEEKGVAVAPLTLHVGFGTFQSVRTQDIRRHVLGEEYFRIEADTAEAIARTRQRGGRVVAVGTTVVRALETAALADGSIRPGEGRTRLLITPGYPFRCVDALITNFHLPKSSLLFLVCAFAGNDIIRRAYKKAVEDGYRFYSYGDAMLIL
ncbi:tRNA preQ1(34) S-adenosylmethionine ribosyltransferase-isomerase QueA [Desulfatiglans anilini]|uniref:tRNA preQ1(34) S-adenosylmethionine ribosyltransferase-isomerase QueA n=1 Tax=Desulfatiglans anilini TaxID=90728 RepID=UPI0003FA1FB0|nr:tRNA preQ1(34) S-adenosylmethionine ribosyltransferase-isomerase QueA [Desulfatiglans anilini]